MSELAKSGRKLALAAAGVACVAAALAAGSPGLARAQSTAQAPAQAPLRFDVASVKPSTQQQYLSTVLVRNSGPEIHWTTQIWYVLQYAYNVAGWEITSPPSPAMATIYEIDATTDPKATDDQVRQMFRSLLADRFKMAMHHESKVMDGYAITVAKSGLEIEEAKDAKIPPLPGWLPQSYRSVDPATNEHWIWTSVQPGGSLVVGRRVTMLQLCKELQRDQQVPVIDQTGLTGDYYFAFEYLPKDAPPDADAPSLSDALKHLGLNLEKYRGPVDIIVIDHIESPTAN
jgi:uncharacterized protein (TIGR03435 family)